MFSNRHKAGPLDTLSESPGSANSQPFPWENLAPLILNPVLGPLRAVYHPEGRPRFGGSRRLQPDVDHGKTLQTIETNHL